VEALLLNTQHRKTGASRLCELKQKRGNTTLEAQDATDREKPVDQKWVLSIASLYLRRNHASFYQPELRD